jgi:hypothetical protein
LGRGVFGGLGGAGGLGALAPKLKLVSKRGMGWPSCRDSGHFLHCTLPQVPPDNPPARFTRPGATVASGLLIR